MPQGLKIEYSEAQLRLAVANANSWREVMRQLGYQTRNGLTSQRLQHEATVLGIDSNHFCQMGLAWTDAEIRRAIDHSATWLEVVVALRGTVGSRKTLNKIKAHAARLGLNVGHLAIRHRVRDANSLPFDTERRSKELRRYAGSVATAWFMRRGYPVSVPVESCPFDFLAEASGIFYKIQVKTTSRGNGACIIGQVPSRNGQLVAYEKDEVDFFFIVCPDDDLYLIPFEEVGGQTSVSLSTIRHRKVDF